MEQQECCLTRLAVLLGVLRLTGTHQFKGAAETYYAPAVAGVRRAQVLLSAGQDPGGPFSLPPLHLSDTSALI